MLLAKFKESSLEKLDLGTCLTQYTTAIQSNRRKVFVVIGGEDGNRTSSVPAPASDTHMYHIAEFEAILAVFPAEASDLYKWICSGLHDSPNSSCANRLGELKNSPVPWRMRGQRPVQYCLSESAALRCKLRLSRYIAIVVTMLNFCRFRLATLSPSKEYMLPIKNYGIRD